MFHMVSCAFLSSTTAKWAFCALPFKLHSQNHSSDYAIPIFHPLTSAHREVVVVDEDIFKEWLDLCVPNIELQTSGGFRTSIPVIVAVVLTTFASIPPLLLVAHLTYCHRRRIRGEQRINMIQRCTRHGIAQLEVVMGLVPKMKLW